MERLSFSLLTIVILSFIIVHSCSSEEDDTTAPNVVQTPEPEPSAPTQYSLTVTAGEGGTVSSEGGTYDEGTDVTITATPSEGYRFTGWEGNDSTSESLTITLNSNQTYQALFELIPIYTLSVTTSEGGTVSTEGGEYEEGTEIEVTATPNEGYRFIGWEESASVSETLIITLDSNQTYQALFELIPPVQYTLTLTASEGGTVSTTTGGGTYDEGTIVTITATPSEGYSFVEWTTPDGSRWGSSNLNVTMFENRSFQAVFELNPIFTFSMNTTGVANDPEIFNYDIYADYKEKTVDFYPFAFFASDLSQNVINGINLALKTAADVFGKYGPVEYWVFGTDKQASLDLINKFCERRETLNQWTMSECLARETDESLDYSMIAYQMIGEGVIKNNRPRGGAAHNGGSQWGIHKMSHSYPFSFDNLFEGIPPQDDFKTVLHEYFHVVQLSSVYSLEYEKMDDTLKPNKTIWLMEGGAEYMANYTLFKLINNGTLSFEKSWGSLKEKMSQKMENGKRFFQQDCPNSLLNEFNHQFCRDPGYDLGSWGVAYLLNKVNNQNALLEIFYPNLKELGFEGAFNLSFGYSTAEFYNEFYEFLKLPIEQQLEIIPDI